MNPHTEMIACVFIDHHNKGWQIKSNCMYPCLRFFFKSSSNASRQAFSHKAKRSLRDCGSKCCIALGALKIREQRLRHPCQSRTGRRLYWLQQATALGCKNSAISTCHVPTFQLPDHKQTEGSVATASSCCCPDRAPVPVHMQKAVFASDQCSGVATWHVAAASLQVLLWGPDNHWCLSKSASARQLTSFLWPLQGTK